MQFLLHNLNNIVKQNSQITILQNVIQLLDLA